MRSSRSATCARSHCASRAISLVSRWSHNVQPSRSASSLAIPAAPLPNSRSTVMILTLSIVLSDCNLAFARVVLFQDKGENEHDHGCDGENPKRIDVGQRCRLALRGLIDPRMRLHLSLIEA